MQKPPKNRKEKSLLMRTLVLSLFLHIIFSFFLSKKESHLEEKTQKPLKIKIVKKKKKLPKNQRIIETKQKKTEPPIDAEHLGKTDHKAKKQQQTKKKPHSTIGDAGRVDAIGNKSSKQKDKKISKKPLKEKKDSLLSRSLNLMKHESLKQFQERTYDKVPEGKTLDLSTSEFRYVGYFTSIRKQITMTWTYPSQAIRAGQQGNAYVKFIIEKNGDVSSIQIISSSGHEILDSSIVQAIQEASPFPPIPKDFGEDQLKITNNFTYSLSFFP